MRGRGISCPYELPLIIPEQLKSKKVFTTSDIAYICNVTTVTIQNWIDNSYLRAYRTPGRHTRVSRDDLVSFLVLHKMPGIKLIQTEEREEHETH